jgi:hypothetical protein
MPSFEGSLTTDHVSCVTHHDNTDKWVAVSVPVYDSLVVIFCDHFGWVVLFLRPRDRDVNMANLIVNYWNKIDASNTRHDCQCLRVLPSIIHELGLPVYMISMKTNMSYW